MDVADEEVVKPPEVQEPAGDTSPKDSNNANSRRSGRERKPVQRYESVNELAMWEDENDFLYLEGLAAESEHILFLFLTLKFSARSNYSK